ncbi:unnamed protein product [Amoebophrya sp. A120]|nr:unnamed protein product [Amoebophrya sp. A120]|eukprot:GSA120T00007831001.1
MSLHQSESLSPTLFGRKLTYGERCRCTRRDTLDDRKHEAATSLSLYKSHNVESRLRHERRHLNTSTSTCIPIRSPCCLRHKRNILSPQDEGKTKHYQSVFIFKKRGPAREELLAGTLY